MNIDHVNISAPVELLERVKAFYCEVLGMSVGYRPKLSSNGYWLYAGNQALIHLVESNAHFRNEKPGYLDHFALRTSGLAEMLERMEEQQVDHRVKQIPETGVTQIFCKDPSGTGVEISFINESR